MSKETWLYSIVYPLVALAIFQVGVLVGTEVEKHYAYCPETLD